MLISQTIKNKVHNSTNYFSFLVYLYMMFRLSTFYHFQSSSISIFLLPGTLLKNISVLYYNFKNCVVFIKNSFTIISYLIF